jgi:hypothetical protein
MFKSLIMIGGNLAMANFLQYDSEEQFNEAYEQHMNSKDEQHKWENVELPEKLKSDFKAKYLCTKGDCKCEKLLSKFDNYPQYQRAGQMYSYAPDCYGSIPLNMQPID